MTTSLSEQAAGEIWINEELSPDNISEIVRYHNEYYAENYGFNHDFGKYVESPLLEFYQRKCPDEHIWLLHDHSVLKGCVALVKNSDEEAQLRWFYVDESFRGQGYGQKLMDLLLLFAAGKKYRRIILWTVSLLEAARKVYERNDFVLAEEHEIFIWGQNLVEQKFVKNFDKEKLQFSIDESGFSPS